MSEEIRYEYTYFHLPEGDHYPVPKSFGGQFEFTNCIVRPKIANMMRQNLNDELLKEALKTTALSYNINQNA